MSIVANSVFSERDETVAQMFDSIRGMVYNFARKFNLEFDDCLQHAALIMLEVWPCIPPTCINVQAYLNAVVRRQLYNLLRKSEPAKLSLDAPVSSDSSTTFADMLQAFAHSERDTQREDFVEQATHAALKQCRLEEQLYAREKFGLNSFNPVPSGPAKYGRRHESMRASLKRRLAKDAQLMLIITR